MRRIFAIRSQAISSRKISRPRPRPRQAIACALMMAFLLALVLPIRALANQALPLITSDQQRGSEPP